jgi:hypothetical protein
MYSPRCTSAAAGSVLAVVIVWSCLLLAGLAATAVWESRPGTFGATPSAWPPHTTITHVHEGFTLLLFAHPQCPCTRASLDELEWLLSRSQGHILAQVIFTRPSAAPPDWEKTDSWERARSIPGVLVRSDPGGADARRFGASTSGSVLMFDAGGALVFHGGITAARGHAGDNAGASAVLDAIDHRGPDACTPVFGCPLFDEMQSP